MTTNHKNESPAPDILISAVGFKLTPAIEEKAFTSLSKFETKRTRVHRIRAKLRFFDNGPRRDSFQVRIRLELPGRDLETTQEGFDLYQLIQITADTAWSRLKEKSTKRQTVSRKRT